MAKSEEKKGEPLNKITGPAAVRAAAGGDHYALNAIIVRCASEVTGGYTAAQQAVRLAIKDVIAGDRKSVV